MTGCKDGSLPVVSRELDETIESLVPAVTDLLQRITGAAPAVTEGEGSDVELSAPLRFPDGIGKGQVVASLFRWRNAVRLDVEIVHNRAFVTAEGIASDRHCFLNDFQASATLPAGTTELPAEFKREVVSGISAAKDAVQRYNRHHEAPWSQVGVVER